MSTKQKFCSECGAPLEESDRFCPVCGAKVVVDEPDQKKSPTKKVPNPPPVENENRSTDDAQSENPLPRPKSTKKIQQGNGKSYDKDSAPGNNKWLIIVIILSLIIAGGVYVYIDQQNQKRSYDNNPSKQNSDLPKSISYLENTQQSPFINITKQMLLNRVFYTKVTNGYGQAKFFKSSFKPFDGYIILNFLNEDGSFRGSVQTNYLLKNGKIIIYSNDGAKLRVTLISSTSNSWTIIEEKDSDGDDNQFGYGQPVNKVYYIKKPKNYPYF